jgi:hypothetical protein
MVVRNPKISSLILNVRSKHSLSALVLRYKINCEANNIISAFELGCLYGDNSETVKIHVLISVLASHKQDFKLCLLKIYKVETTHLPDITNELKLNNFMQFKPQIYANKTTK